MSTKTFNPRRDFWFPAKYLDQPIMKEYLDAADKIYSGSFSNDSWKTYHDLKLREILYFVKSKSNFWRQKLSNISVSAMSIERISELPFTTKNDMRNQDENILCGDIRDRVIYYETTGTTGKPVKAPRSWFESFASNYHASMNMAHLTEQQFGSRKPIIGILGPTEVHPFGDEFGDIFRNIDVSHIKFWPYSPKIGFKRATELISEIGVEVLLGTPAVMLPLIRYATKAEVNYEKVCETVKLILTVGEVTSSAMRSNLSALYGQALCQPGVYGGADLGIIASTCGHGRMHFAKQNYVAEVLDPWTGQVVGDGSVGELVLTSLVPGIRPLIRYRTGDLISVEKHACLCGNATESFRNHGRVTDIIQLGGQYYLASEFEQLIMEGISGFFGYQITIDSKCQTDTLQVDLERISGRQNGIDPGDLIQKRLANILDIPVTVNTIDSLPPVVNTGGFISWKSARVNDLRAPLDLDRVAAMEIAARWLNGYTPRLDNA